MSSAAARYDVVVVGNAGVDTNVYLGGPLDLGRETAFTDNVDGVGQSGGYSARGFARLGYRTAFVGYLGDDALGRFVRDELTADGVDMGHTLVDPAGTNRSVNLMSTGGGRHSFFDGKSHMTLVADEAAWGPVLQQATLIHFSIPNWARRLLAIARSGGAVVSVDLQDAFDVNDPYRREFVEAADLLFASAANLPDVRGALEAWHRPGRITVCTMGARGCALRTDDGYREHPAVDLDAPIVDTNGAGDSLAVGMLAACVLDGRPLDEAVHRGQVAARWCCSRRGSSDLITRARLDELAVTGRSRPPGDAVGTA